MIIQVSVSTGRANNLRGERLSAEGVMLFVMNAF